jgi:RluA family pseudouridine synthase
MLAGSRRCCKGIAFLFALTCTLYPAGGFLSAPLRIRHEAILTQGSCHSARDLAACTPGVRGWAHSQLRGGGYVVARESCVSLKGLQAPAPGDESKHGSARAQEGNNTRVLTVEQREEALRYIGPELLALHTAENGTVNYKALSKLVPLRADKGELEVLLEDENLIAVSKPEGMAMNPPHRFLSGTLVNRMLGYLGGEKPPHVLHRLDMWTSGVVVFSKNKTLVPMIHRLFRLRQVKKEYMCLVDGLPSPEHMQAGSLTVDAPIEKDASMKIMRKVDDAGQPSQTVFQVVAVSHMHNVTLLRASPLTGRTHQIRVHARHIGLPIVGDNVYGLESALYDDEADMLRSDQKAFPGDVVRHT